MRLEIMIPLALVAAISASSAQAGSAQANSAQAAPLSQGDLDTVDRLYRDFLAAENRHDLEAMRAMVADSPDTLFIAKTATPAEGNWAGFWGKATVMSHFGQVISGPFHIEPDTTKARVTGLGADVAQVYVPVMITVAYAGQSGTPKPFLAVFDWVRRDGTWKLISDIAIPVPAAPPPAHP